MVTYLTEVKVIVVIETNKWGPGPKEYRREDGESISDLLRRLADEYEDYEENL